MSKLTHRLALLVAFVATVSLNAQVVIQDPLYTEVASYTDNDRITELEFSEVDGHLYGLRGSGLRIIRIDPTQAGFSQNLLASTTSLLYSGSGTAWPTDSFALDPNGTAATQEIVLGDSQATSGDVIQWVFPDPPIPGDLPLSYNTICTTVHPNPGVNRYWSMVPVPVTYPTGPGAVVLPGQMVVITNNDPGGANLLALDPPSTGVCDPIDTGAFIDLTSSTGGQVANPRMVAIAPSGDLFLTTSADEVWVREFGASSWTLLVTPFLDLQQIRGLAWNAADDTLMVMVRGIVNGAVGSIYALDVSSAPAVSFSVFVEGLDVTDNDEFLELLAVSPDGEYVAFKDGNGLVTRILRRNDCNTGPANLACLSGPSGSVDLFWQNAAPYSSIEVRRDGTLLTVLPATATSFTDPSPGAFGSYFYEVRAICPNGSQAGTACGPVLGGIPPAIDCAFTLAANPAFGSFDAAGQGTAELVVSLTQSAGTCGGNPSNDPVYGYQFGLGHSSNELEAVSVEFLDLGIGSLSSAFQFTEVLTDGVTVGVALVNSSNQPVFTVAPADLVRVTYAPAAAAVTANPTGYSATVDFPGNLGSPLVADQIVLSAAGLAVAPTTVAGSVNWQNDQSFRRGLVRDGAILGDSPNIADVIRILGQLFQGVPTSCQDASDANDDGVLNIADAVSLVTFLFASGPPPPLPFANCGTDPTPDGLDCLFPVGC